jgi:ABC-type nitrate/sulfonate/bicarbonate transport system substrate-binding protein
MKLKQFRIVEINSRDLSAQFVAGRLPVIVNYEPWAGKAVDRGNGVVLATSADFRGCIPECIWGYRRTVNTMPDEDIYKILTGWIKAVRWLRQPEHRDEYYTILKNRTFKTETALSDAALSEMLNAVSIHSLHELRERNKDAGGLFQYLIALRSFLNDNNMLHIDFSPDTIFENRYIVSVLNAIGKKEKSAE